MSNALKRFRSALPALALVAMSLTACSGGSGNPVSPIRGAAEPTATPTAVASVSPTPVATATATPAPTGSPTTKPTSTPTPVKTAAPTATPTVSPAPSTSPVGTTLCNTTLASGPVAQTGFVLIPLDGPLSGFQRIQFETGSTVNSNPASNFCLTYQTADADNVVDTIASSNGSRGLVLGIGINGSPQGVEYALPFFGGFTNTPLLGPAVNYAPGFPGVQTAVVIPDTGDEALATGGAPPNTLVEISGIASSVPKAAGTLTTPADASATVLSSDGHTLVVRSSGASQIGIGLTTFAIAQKTPTVGPLGGTLSHTYTKTGSLNHGFPNGIINAPLMGRGAMSADPADPSRVVLTGYQGGDMEVQVVTGLPSAPTIGPSVVIEPGKSGVPTSVAVSRDGKYAFAATPSGIDTVTGIGTGTLTVVGTTYLPAAAPRLTTVESLVTSVDGKYLLAVTGSGSQTIVLDGVSLYGELVVIPIGANGVLGAPVLVDDNTGAVEDDSMLVF